MTEESRNTPNTYERRIDGYARILKKQLGEDRQIVCVLVAFAGMFFVSGVMTGRLPQLGEAKGIFFAF